MGEKPEIRVVLNKTPQVRKALSKIRKSKKIALRQGTVCRPRPFGLILRVPDRDLQDMVIFNVLGDLILP